MAKSGLGRSCRPVLPKQRGSIIFRQSEAGALGLPRFALIVASKDGPKMPLVRVMTPQRSFHIPTVRAWRSILTDSWTKSCTMSQTEIHAALRHCIRSIDLS